MAAPAMSLHNGQAPTSGAAAFVARMILVELTSASLLLLRQLTLVRADLVVAGSDQNPSPRHPSGGQGAVIKQREKSGRYEEADGICSLSNTWSNLRDE